MKKAKLSKQRIIIGIIVVFLFVGVVALRNFFETRAPEIILSPEPAGFLPASKEFTVTFIEKGLGLKECSVFIEQDNKNYPIFYKRFSREDKTYNQRINLNVIPKKLGVHDGPAFFVVSAQDYSFWHWGKGNAFQKRYSVIIDTVLPTIEVLTRSHNIAKGGSGLVIYRALESLLHHGVKAGKLFYPGYQWQGLYLCLFAYPYYAPKNIVYRLVGEDKAGNRGEVGFYYHLLPRKFRHDKINISDAFLQAKMPEFWNIYPNLRGKYLETFVKVNTELRKKNHQEIRHICSISQATPLWQGAFIRPRGTKRAGFLDQRTYYYKGKPISHSVHQGVDIASIAHAPVIAGNHGIVVYRDYLGIYGNTIIIDHGLGLFSLYGHLSNFQVEKNQRVKKGDVIGYTGTTGLAGGDHLHFSILVQGEFVNPVEWWDAHWVKNNITQKMIQNGLLK